MRINEQSALTVSVSLLEDDRTAALPSTCHWRLECLSTGTVLQEWTALTLTSNYNDDGVLADTTTTIELSALLHVMQTSTLAIERKALCIAADKGLATEWNTELIYEVERLNARS